MSDCRLCFFNNNKKGRSARPELNRLLRKTTTDTKGNIARALGTSPPHKFYKIHIALGALHFSSVDDLNGLSRWTVQLQETRATFALKCHRRQGDNIMIPGAAEKLQAERLYMWYALLGSLRSTVLRPELEDVTPRWTLCSHTCKAGPGSRQHDCIDPGGATLSGCEWRMIYVPSDGLRS